MRLWHLGLLFGLSLAGCATGVTTPPLVSGPHATLPPWELFEHVLASARAEGYEPEDVNLDAGVFRVHAREAEDEETVFVTKFYQGGWLQVWPAGPRVGAEGPVSRVTPEVRRELVAYLAALSAAAGGRR
ncbi:MAG: hypothetical protein AB8I08_35945 [Sandaracinaceae bacterium]